MLLELIFTLTKVKMFSDCVIKATLDHPNCLMSCMIPVIISASLDTVLRKCGNTSVLERRGDDDPGEIYSKFSKYVYPEYHMRIIIISNKVCMHVTYIQVHMTQYSYLTGIKCIWLNQ